MATAHDAPSTVPQSGPESRWWFGAVAYLLFSLFATFLALPLFLVVVLGGYGYGASFTIVAMFSTLVALLGVAVAVLLPVSIYMDGQAILESNADWQPDVTLLTILGVVGVLASPLGLGVAAYYLYKRHEHVGIP